VFHGQNAAIHDGPAVRSVPMTPELRPILRTLFDHARAGHELWPSLLHNIRASCATDWAEALPAHVVAKWLGHRPLVAAKHYLQTRAAHLEVAISGVPRAGKAEAQPVA
jgi:integrase